MGQVFNVNAPGSNVGSHQGTNVATFEFSQCLGSCGLTFVTVQSHGLDAILGEIVGHVVGAKLGTCEHQNLTPIVQVDDVRQNFFFLAATHRVNHLRNSLHGCVAGGDLNALRVFQERGCQIANFIAESGREQQALFVFGNQCQDFLDIMDESHVEHAICLVQDQNFNTGQI